MRISDWSSDVCSSDLLHHRRRGEPEAAPDADREADPPRRKHGDVRDAVPDRYRQRAGIFLQRRHPALCAEEAGGVAGSTQPIQQGPGAIPALVLERDRERAAPAESVLVEQFLLRTDRKSTRLNSSN